MKPVFARVALYHVIVNQLGLMRLSTVAVDIKECLVVHITLVSCLLTDHRRSSGRLRRLGLLHRPINLTSHWHLGVAAVTSEIELGVELMYFVTLVAVKHAGDTEAMRLHVLRELSFFLCLILTVFEDNFWLKALDLEHLLVACLAGEDGLVDIAVFISALALHVLYNRQ